MAPDRPEALTKYFEQERLPFEAIADPEQRVLKAFGQQYRWYLMGLLPAMVAIAPEGRIVWRHYAKSPADLPDLDIAASALGKAIAAP
jgi:peroxiredoxin